MSKRYNWSVKTQKFDNTTGALLLTMHADGQSASPDKVELEKQLRQRFLKHHGMYVVQFSASVAKKVIV